MCLEQGEQEGRVGEGKEGGQAKKELGFLSKYHIKIF